MRRDAVMLDLLHDVANDAAIFSIPAKDAISHLLTLGGRANIQDGYQTLASFDRAVADLLPDVSSHRVSKHALCSDGHIDCSLYFNALGRLHIRFPTDPVIDNGLGPTIPIGHLALDASFMERAIARADGWRKAETQSRRTVTQILEDQEHSKTLSSFLDEVYDSVQHVEAVAFYIDDRLFAAVERINNLTTTRRGAGLLDLLRVQPLSAWSEADKLAVVALRSLFLSGKSVRFEEFNGSELSAVRLIDKLTALGRGYAAILDREFDQSQPLLTLAQTVGQLAGAIGSGSGVRYRKVNGLTFQKAEHIITHRESDAVRTRCEDAFGAISELRSLPNDADRCNYFRTAAHAAIDETVRELSNRTSSAPAEGAATTSLELLIEQIVGSAVLATNADYGMSSSLRRPGELVIDDTDQFLNRVAELTPKDFYCCMVALNRLRTRYGDRLSGDIFRAVQARMQYNRWHFIPGNLPRDRIPADRNFFYPPVVPDVAEWVDQYHAGHSRAGVRYSIRAPGPEIVQPPLKLCQFEFRGFYDIRVVRMEGQPFSTEDLLVTRTHCLWMGAVWRAIIERCADMRVREGLRITGFTNGFGKLIDEEGRPEWPLKSERPASEPSAKERA